MYLFYGVVGNTGTGIEFFSEQVESPRLKTRRTADSHSIAYDNEGEENRENENARIEPFADRYRSCDGNGQSAMAGWHSASFPEKSHENLAEVAGF